LPKQPFSAKRQSAVRDNTRCSTKILKKTVKINKHWTCHAAKQQCKLKTLINISDNAWRYALLVLGNSGLCWTVFARNRDTAVPAEGNGNLQTLICVLVVRPRRCPTLSNPVPWQNWMVAYLGYTLRMETLFCGWPVMVYDTHTRRRTSTRSRLAFNSNGPTMSTGKWNTN